MNAKNQQLRLGKGLGDLFANTDDESESTEALKDGSYLAQLPVQSIVPNPRQPREVFDEDDLAELAASIGEFGVLQPVVVRAVGKDSYELVMGERRLRASKMVGIKAIPAIVRGTEDQDLLRDALLENLHRANLNPLEEARAYQQLLEDFGCSKEELARRIHRSRPQISNTLRLLVLPTTVQVKLASGVITAGHARALLGLDDASAQEQLAHRIIAEGLSVRATEEIVALAKNTVSRETVSRVRREPSIQERELAGTLSDHFDTRVKVNIGRAKGKITIEFAAGEDLDRILRIIDPAT